MVSCSSSSVFEGDGKHLIGLHGGFQRHVTQMTVQRVFRRAEQTSILNLFIIHTTLHNAIERRAGLVDDAGFGIVAQNDRVEVVGIVLWKS